jgi:anti-sigma factor RsiW
MSRAVLLHPLRFRRDHRFTRAQASAYLDGELGPEDRRRIESHTHMCPPCARFMAGLRRTVSALGKLRGTETPRASVSDGVLARLREEPHNGGGGAPPPV